MNKIIYFISNDSILHLYEIAKEISSDNGSDFDVYDIITSHATCLFFYKSEIREMNNSIYFDECYSAWCTFNEKLAINKLKELLKDDTRCNNEV